MDNDKIFSAFNETLKIQSEILNSPGIRNADALLRSIAPLKAAIDRENKINLWYNKHWQQAYAPIKPIINAKFGVLNTADFSGISNALSSFSKTINANTYINFKRADFQTSLKKHFAAMPQDERKAFLSDSLTGFDDIVSDIYEAESEQEYIDCAEKAELTANDLFLNGNLPQKETADIKNELKTNNADDKSGIVYQKLNLILAIFTIVLPVIFGCMAHADSVAESRQNEQIIEQINQAAEMLKEIEPHLENSQLSAPEESAEPPVNDSD